MGAISTTININAQSAQSTIERLAEALMRTERVANRLGNTPIGAKVDTSKLTDGYKAVESHIKSAANATEQIGRAQDRVTSATRNTQRMQGNVSKEIQRQNALLGGGVRLLIRAWATISGIRGLYMALNSLMGFFNESLLLANKTATALRNTVGTMGSTGLAAAAVDMDKFYFAANRARTGYLEFAQTASKFMIVAPDAFATDNDAIRFTETLSKSLQLAGAEASEVNSVLLQVSQGLSSGYLQGDELRALRENGGMAAQALADYLGTTVGGLKELGAQGAITADVLVAALAAASTDIDAQFLHLPMTISQQLAIASNYIRKSVEPLAKRIQDLLNTEQFKRFAEAAKKAWDAIIVVMGIVVSFITNYMLPAITAVIDAIDWFLWSSDSLAQFLRGVLLAAIIVVGIYLAWLGATALASGIQMFVGWLLSLGPVGLVIAALIAVIALFGWIATVAGWAGDFVSGVFFVIGFVVGFVVGLIIDIILIAIRIIIVAVYFILTSIFATATAIVSVVGAVVGVVLTIILGAIASIVHAFAFIVDAVAAVASAASSAANALANAFVSAVNIAVDAINVLIGALNNIPGISIGTVSHMGAVDVGDWGAGMAGFASDVHATADGLYSAIGDYWSGYGDTVSGLAGMVADSAGATANAVSNVPNGLINPIDMGNRWGNGAIGIGNSIGDAIMGLLPQTPGMPSEDFLFPGGGSGAGDGSGGGAGSRIADTTEDIKNLLERMKDLAERNAVAKFTAVYVDIDMDNTIEQTDLDGVITYVTDSMNGALNNSLAGVL